MRNIRMDAGWRWGQVAGFKRHFEEGKSVIFGDEFIEVGSSDSLRFKGVRGRLEFHFQMF